MPFLVAQYDRWQRKRLDVKPGITGLWQVLGRKDLPLEQNLQYDFYYIKNRTILMDLVILLKTIRAVIIGKGAF
jgi:lipopolysaccharide/colanic/teichoic acid biosynthesis glycosyltransferase